MNLGYANIIGGTVVQWLISELPVTVPGLNHRDDQHFFLSHVLINLTELFMSTSGVWIFKTIIYQGINKHNK